MAQAGEGLEQVGNSLAQADGAGEEDVEGVGTKARRSAGSFRGARRRG